MLLVFWIVFSVPVISRIDSIGGGRAGWGWGGGRGGWEAEGGLKQPFGLKQQCCALSMGHRLVESTREVKTAVLTREEQPGTPCSPINVLQGHEMHPGGLTASVKSRL